MLYNGHVAIADTVLRKRPNHGQTLKEKSLYSRHFYSGHFFEHCVNILGKKLTLNDGHGMVGWENGKHMHVFISHMSLLEHEAHYLTFPGYFPPML